MPDCEICGRAREEQPLLGPSPGACCAAIAERHDEYFHIPKLFTWSGLLCQGVGIKNLLRATALCLMKRSDVSQSHGRLRGLPTVVRFWLWGWSVLKREGWVHTRFHTYTDDPIPPCPEIKPRKHPPA